MRTTLSLEPDVAAELKRLRRSDPRSFKRLVNDLLRMGLRHLSDRGSSTAGKRFRTRVVSLGTPLIDLDNVVEALAIAEGEDHK